MNDLLVLIEVNFPYVETINEQIFTHKIKIDQY